MLCHFARVSRVTNAATVFNNVSHFADVQVHWRLCSSCRLPHCAASHSELPIVSPKLIADGWGARSGSGGLALVWRCAPRAQPLRHHQQHCPAAVGGAGLHGKRRNARAQEVTGAWWFKHAVAIALDCTSCTVLQESALCSISPRAD